MRLEEFMLLRYKICSARFFSILKEISEHDVSYTQCTKTDHLVLLTSTEPTDEFIEALSH
jgi:hypothetical protein